MFTYVYTKLFFLSTAHLVRAGIFKTIFAIFALVSVFSGIATKITNNSALHPKEKTNNFTVFQAVPRYTRKAHISRLIKEYIQVFLFRTYSPS